MKIVRCFVHANAVVIFVLSLQTVWLWYFPTVESGILNLIFLFLNVYFNFEIYFLFLK